MKKMLTFVMIFIASIVIISDAKSATTYNTTAGKQKVQTIGQNILTKNGLPKQVTFKVVESTEINAYADADNNVIVYTGLLEKIENDDELAGILAHEIGHIMKRHCYKQTFLAVALDYTTSAITDEKLATGAQVASALTSTKVSREQEYDADYTSADLMYKAGYNPLGLISILNKISSNYVDILEDHPSSSKRLSALYDYVSYNYPASVKKGMTTTSYANFNTTIQSTLKERDTNKKKYDKYVKTQKKLKEKRIKAAQKMLKTNDPWAMGYSTLKALTVQSSSGN